MLWFQRLFPLCMILFPLAFTLLSGRAPERRHDEVPRRMRGLWIMTFAALALGAAMQSWIESDPERLMLLSRAWPVGFGVAGFFVLWFGFAMPALAARQPGWSALPHPGSPEPVRSASLVRRDTGCPIPRGAWIMGWALFGLCAGAIGWSLAQGAPTMLLLGLGFWVGLGVFGSRSSLIEAEPMDTAGSAELAEAWAALRRFKAWCFYATGLLGTIGFAAVSVVTVFAPDVAGLAGAALGTTAGLAGGVFGTMASVRRARIHARLQELGANGARGPVHTT